MSDSTRECYLCKSTITHADFQQSVFKNNYLKTFGWELLIEIWDNPIFILKCCRCFTGIRIVRGENYALD